MAEKRRLTVVIERDEDGYYVASVPELHGCHTQGNSLDEVMKRIEEAALLCLEGEDNSSGSDLEFVGVQTIEIRGSQWDR